MRFSPILIILGYILSAGAQVSSAAGQAQAVQSPARVALEQMNQAERENSCISVEFESFDSEAVELGHEVERLWNDGQYESALAQLGSLEARAGHVAIGNSWRRPVPAVKTDFWGNDVRVGSRDSLLELSFDNDPLSGNLFVVLRHGAGPAYYSVCMSADTGATWAETFTWVGSRATAVDAAVCAKHLYVAYYSPGENVQQVRVRRFLCSDGSADEFSTGAMWVAACTLDAEDTLREVSFVSSGSGNVYVFSLVSDGSILYSYDDEEAVSWGRDSTGITSGARNGLDATIHIESSSYLFFSYYDMSDTLRIYRRAHGAFGQRFSLPATAGTPTSISAYRDTIVCVYEDEAYSPHRVRYVVDYDDGDTWTTGSLSDTGIAANAPAVTGLGGGGFAAVFRHCSSTPELRFCRYTDSGSWGDPVSIGDIEPYSSRPGISHLGAGVFGVVYLSDTSPVVRGAYFDRSDWAYGIEEQSRPQASTRQPQATVVRRVLFVPKVASLIDIGGRKVADLRAGSNDVTWIAPGVYFVRSEPQATSFIPPAIRKVVIPR